jgi:hypothetical protein
LALFWGPSGATESISIAGAGKAYYLWGDQFILADAPTAGDAQYGIELWYNGLHPLVDPTDEGLLAVELTVPQADRSLLFWYITACMMGKLEASDSNLRQWASRQDLGSFRDDNPPRKSASWRMEKYNTGVALRLEKKRRVSLERRR